MPRKTNCSLGALYDSCLNREDDLKYEIIRERVFVTVPDKDLSFDNVDKDDYAQPTDIKHILDRDQIQIEYSSDVLENIRANNDIYILDDKLSVLNKKAQQTGVAILSEFSDNIKSVTRAWYGEVVANQKNFNWKEFFLDIYDSPCTPSNSAIIIDRYLFSYETVGEYKSTYKDGLRNLKAIFEGILPENINTRYDILVIFGTGDGVLDNKITVDDVCDKIYEIVEQIERPYEINVELLAIKKQCALWGPTHDRRIISNYFLVQAPHGFKAVKGNGEGTYNQLIDAKCIYTGIESQRQRKKGLVIKYCENTLKEIKNSILKLAEYDYTCYNIETECLVSSIRNRLLRN